MEEVYDQHAVSRNLNYMLKKDNERAKLDDEMVTKSSRLPPDVTLNNKRMD